MRHPEFLAIPVLMLLDYYLTIAGAIMKERKHGEHFKTEHYELNPIWQRAVARKQWFNPRQLFLTLAIGGLTLLLVNAVPLNDGTNVSKVLVDALFGYFLGMYGLIIGRHLSNLLIFRHLCRNPSGLSGVVTMDHLTSLALSTWQYVSTLVPVLFIGLWVATPFSYGTCLGALGVLCAHLIWRRKAVKARVRREATPLPGESPSRKAP